MSAPLTAAEGEVLADLAIAAIAARLAGHALSGSEPDSAALRERGASFVTLEAAGRLRGCIGSLEPARPLYQDVIRNALRAMKDPRMPPVTAVEWPELTVSVAVLSAAEPLLCRTRDALLAALRPGVDGVILAHGRRRATFLPKVWQKLATPERFVAGLLAKGGWPPDPWPANLAASRYTVIEYGAACAPS
jgi:uncharacterized protein